MKAIINSDSNLEVQIASYDLCSVCINLHSCPLIQGILKEKVFLHYEETVIEECGLFKEI